MRSHRINLVLAAATLVLLVIPTSALAQRQTETVDRTLPFPNGGTLELKNFSGDIRITTGTGRDFVMKAVRRGRADRLKEIPLKVDTVGSRIVVDAHDRGDNRSSDNNVIDTTFDIQIPADAMLEIDSFSGDITVTGTRGAVQAKTFSGRIDVDATGHGVTPAVELETFSGSMHVRLAENAKGDIAFRTFSGDLDAAFPVTLKSTGRRNIRAELPGGTGRTLAFESFSGSLRLTR